MICRVLLSGPQAWVRWQSRFSDERSLGSAPAPCRSIRQAVSTQPAAEEAKPVDTALFFEGL